MGARLLKETMHPCFGFDFTFFFFLFDCMFGGNDDEKRISIERKG